MTRRHVPCRECGRDHQNPRSSSLCPDCAPAVVARNEELARLNGELTGPCMGQIMAECDCPTPRTCFQLGRCSRKGHDNAV